MLSVSMDDPAGPKYFWIILSNIELISMQVRHSAKTLRLPMSGLFETKSAGTRHWAEIVGISAGPRFTLGHDKVGWDSIHVRIQPDVRCRVENRALS
jgi:hypothetical protein